MPRHSLRAGAAALVLRARAAAFRHVGSWVTTLDRLPAGLCVVAALAGSALLFGLVASYRLIDADEGYYLLAARLVASGAHAYRDFFYPQMPGLPYAYAAWLQPEQVSWFSGRLMSSTFAALIGLLVYLEVSRSTRSRGAALIAVAGLLSSSLAFGWFTVVKTYALAALLLMLATFVIATPVSVADVRRATVRAAVAGVLAGLAIDVRLLSLAVIPAFVVHLVLSGTFRRRLSSLAALGGGLIVGIAPCLPLARDAGVDRFVFNNVGYHGLRSDGGLIGGWTQKLRVLFDLIGDGIHQGNVTGVQFAILVACGVSCVRRRHEMARFESARLYLLAAACLGLLRLLPTPTFDQYFSVTVPFLVVAAGVALSHVLRRGAANSPGGWIPLGLCGLALLAPLDLWRYHDGRRVPGVGRPSAAEAWRIHTVNEVAAFLDTVTCPGDPVISTWPGYVLGSHATTVRGMENHFGWSVANRLTPAEAERYSILSDAGLTRAVRSRVAPVALVDLWGPEIDLARVLLDAGYVESQPLGAARVFRDPATRAACRR